MLPFADHRALSIKAAIAALLAWVLGQAMGNPDGVSAAFVAVICTSPIVLSGLKRARDQLVGSLLGGVTAAVFALMGVPLWLALPLSIGAAVWLTVVLRLQHGYQIAAFTAIYLLLVPRGSPLETLTVRMGAVGVGAMAANVVNGLVSFAMYRQIFARKMRLAIDLVSGELLRLAQLDEPPIDGVEAVFGRLAALAAELDDACKELNWRNFSPLQQTIRAQHRTALRLAEISHFARHAVLTVRDERRRWSDAERAGLTYASDRLCEVFGGTAATGRADTRDRLSQPVPVTLQRLIASIERV